MILSQVEYIPDSFTGWLVQWILHS